MVAEFTLNKRHRDVVQAIARLNRSDIRVAFVGPGGPHRAEVEAQAAQLGLDKVIHFLGYRQDIPAILRAAACATLTSQREGLPRSVMEALSLEVPVVGADTRGIRDLLAGGGGIIVPIGDTARLAEAIRDLVDNPEKSRAIGASGRRSMAPYSLPNVISLHEQLYQRALGVCFPI